MEELIKQTIESCRGLPDGITLIIISMIPVFGIRGGMVASYFLQTPVIKAVILCVTGNFIPVLPIYVFGRFLKDYFKKHGALKKIILNLEKKADQHSELIERYGFWGIILFIALPLPGTGAYMGTFIAAISHMSAKRAISAVICGMVLSGVIMGIIISRLYVL